MHSARISSKSQIVIPAEVRRKLGLHPGDVLDVEVEDDRIVLRKTPESWLERLAAFRGEHWEGVAEEIQRERDEWYREQEDGSRG